MRDSENSERPNGKIEEVFSSRLHGRIGTDAPYLCLVNRPISGRDKKGPIPRERVARWSCTADEEGYYNFPAGYRARCCSHSRCFRSSAKGALPTKEGSSSRTKADFLLP